MRGHTHFNNKELFKYMDNLQNYIVRCKCSHLVLIKRNQVFAICDYCGERVYRNEKDEFKDRLKEKLYGRDRGKDTR